MLKVGINGYGTIGKRVADFVVKHPKLELVGVVKYTPDQDARLANVNGMNLFTSKESLDNFKSKNIEVKGTVDDIVEASDVIVDASPDGKAIGNKQNIYIPKNKKVIFQGGEEADIADVSFNARSNFNSAIGKQFIRVVSCNTTGYCRLIKPLMENYKIKNINAYLIRRGADPADTKGSALNSVEWKAKSHHADDVKTVIDVNMTSVAFKVPHTLSHINSMSIKFDGIAPTKNEILDLYRKENRVGVLNSAKTSAEIIEVVRDLGLKRNDVYMTLLLANTIQIDGNEVFFSFFVPQESIVVPENIDAIVAQTNLMSKEESMKTTDNVFELEKIKKNLENIFA